jgi:divalent anion:Na+ symporter, DASS family
MVEQSTASSGGGGTDAEARGMLRRSLTRWGIVVLAVVSVLASPIPAGIEPISWRFFAIFVGTMVGLVVQPIPGGGMVLLGVAATAVAGVRPLGTALAGYADPLVWLVLSAFMIARGMIKSGMGRRIALLFIRTLGHTSLGLGYSLAITDGLLATVIPSNSARAGGILFPLCKSISESYDSRPGPTANRLGGFLMPLIYQTDVLVCAMFLTGQASNPLIASFALQVTGVEISYGMWALGAMVPGLIALAFIPWMIYKLHPPEITRTPDAAAFARRELESMGPISRQEWLMLGTFLLILLLWLTPKWHGIDYAVVALLGLGALLLTSVLSWEDVVTERAAWDVFIWYGGLLQLARVLTETGITTWFAGATGGLVGGLPWPLVLAVLALVYFYAHYAFASITAHATAMYIPFLTVAIAAGAPPLLTALLLLYFSNLCASLTHYGTTPAPIYFGSRYVSQGRWWKIGFESSVAHVAIWAGIGMVWWKLLGWW